ncbi:MAG: undecaprenyl-diphosphate phosphatase [Candidatus Omnitrophota bacterium]|nr:undecaprenyl-diphosphate phosphatase [Candidatus Omnitrophota bacterium]MBU2528342.1 undecaprenyl-diphosphate phosphatase [bacterium]MBU3930596.1 undecaprenyl-diphosphate phosphatase [bacterium]MBU4122757.1 undecaprenyl-diphosphate phosphatase [bacterium]
MLKSVFLGLVQGLTEFLPVSSSGHLVLANSIMGSSSDAAFKETAFLHLATLLAVLFYFRKGLVSLVRDFFRKAGSGARMTVLYLFIASIPAGIAGVLSKDLLGEIFASNSVWISLFFLLNAALLIGSDFIKEKNVPLNGPKSFFIGILQALAILPGISRSGSTIGAGILCGMTRAKAVEFSFYMSIPAVLFGNLLLGSFDSSLFNASMLLSSVAAFLSGLAAISLLMLMVKRSRLRYFGFYTLAIALINLFFI